MHIFIKILFILCLQLVCTAGMLAQRRLVTLPTTLNEISGMYLAAKDSIWCLNDGGNTPTIFCINLSGKLLHTRQLPIQNRDWEELCSDNTGNLFIGDFGNNNNQRKDLTIYKYHVPTGALDSIQFKFADQTAFPPTQPNLKSFDCEAMVWDSGKLYLFAKCHYSATQFTATCYTLTDQAGQHIAQPFAKLPLHKQVLTGAALSPDAQHIAFTSYLYRKVGKWYIGRSYVHQFAWPQLRTHHQVERISRRRVRGWITARQIESLVYLNAHTLLVASEKTPVQKPKLKKMRLKS